MGVREEGDELGSHHSNSLEVNHKGDDWDLCRSRKNEDKYFFN